MITKEQILQLKSKILPAGAEMVLDFLAGRNHQVDLTQIVLENVPLLIIGRHGMIARLPVNGVVEKVSQPAEIIERLQSFFARQDKLYLFVNLPELTLPAEVTQVIEEVQSRAVKKEELRRVIDSALDTGDRILFEKATRELLALNESEDHIPTWRRH